jgi:hypothetical protein
MTSARSTRTALLAAGLATLAALFAACLCSSAPALGATGASIQPSFAPYRLAARAAGTISLRFAGDGADHVPAPLSTMTLRLPGALSIDLTGVGVCQAARLRSGGASGCPTASLIGRGHALLEVHAGSQILPEDAAVSVFRGPTRGGRPTFEILGHGETPLDESTISTAVLQGDSAPYGLKLVVAVPPIPTLTYEPNASFSSLSLTIGNAGSRAKILLPRSCPPAGFPFAASFGFADGTSAGAAARLRCP